MTFHLETSVAIMLCCKMKAEAFQVNNIYYCEKLITMKSTKVQTLGASHAIQSTLLGSQGRWNRSGHRGHGLTTFWLLSQGRRESEAARAARAAPLLCIMHFVNLM